MFPYSYLSILINANHCLSVHLSVTLNTKTILDVQTFKIHQMKRIEKTNLTLVIYDGFEYVNNGHSTLADCSFATNNLSHINQSFNESGFKTKDNCIVSQ